jgi:hypothetical protein
VVTTKANSVGEFGTEQKKSPPCILQRKDMLVEVARRSK